MRVFLGLILSAGGVFMVVKTRVFLDFFGTVEWAEAKLGGGGSNLFYKLLGIVFILIGFILVFNLWDAFLQATVGSLFPTPQ